MEQTPAKPSLDLGRCLNEALDVYRKNFSTFVLAAILFSMMSLFSLFVLAGPLWGGIVLMTLNAMRHPERKADIGDLFRAFDRFGELVAVFFITAIPIIVGYMLFIVPGVLLSALWLFPTYLIVDQRMSVGDALTTSWKLVLRRGLMINMLAAFVIFALTAGAGIVPYLGIILGWLVAPIAWLVNTSAYVQEVKERSDITDFAPRGFPVVPPVTGAAPAV
jgi:uncharacterized membrane protein